MNALEQLETHHHLWVVDTKVTDAVFANLRDTLSKWEAERAERFAFEKDRIVYTVAHGALRRLLEHYLQRPAPSFEFDLNAFGKPSLRSGEIEFNLSHSGHVALCAFSKKSKIGVDTELMREDVNPGELARQFFSPEEVKIILETRLEERLNAFYRCWTRKEAFVKAHGKGLSIPLDSFSVPIAGDTPTPIGLDPTEEQRCVVHPINLQIRDCFAALAYFGDPRPVTIKSWNQWYESVSG